MKSKNLLFSLILLVGVISILTLSSNSGGINGQSTSGCSCHGANNAATSVSLSGIPAAGYVNGTTYTLSLSISNSTKAAAGFDLTTNIGTLTASAGTSLNGPTEIKHNTPKNAVSGITNWTFDWTAPASGNAQLTINVAGNAVNLNSGTGGDAPNIATFTHNAAVVSAVPTVQVGTPSSINAFGATINGSVNANNANATVTVEYGTTMSLGSSMAMTPSPVTGNTSTAVTAVLSGLLPSTTYHYTIKAVNSVGTTESAHNMFTTSPNGVAEFSKSPFVIFPNPVNDRFIVSSSKNVKNEYVLFDLKGTKQEFSLKNNGINSTKDEIDISKLAAGKYILLISNGDKKYNHLILKQ
ncbi:MAG: T9SS type A sorting domain-containing protein [Chitinophagaceae bacterium]|nr:T9SS type A sorting domain-containing protein [Chitinophagaceae bacterium]